MKCVCELCGWKGDDSQALRSVSPFDPDHELIACPACKQPSVLVAACYADGCWRTNTRVYPFRGQQERACSQHDREQMVVR